MKKNSWPRVMSETHYRATDGYIHVRQLLEWPDGRHETTDICLYIRA